MAVEECAIYGRDVATHGRRTGNHGVCPWGSIFGSPKEDASTFWSACDAIRRNVFMAMKNFDEGYDQPSIEDIELGYRLKQTGHKIRLCKGLQIKHLKRWNIVSLLKSDFFDRALP